MALGPGPSSLATLTGDSLCLGHLGSGEAGITGGGEKKALSIFPNGLTPSLGGKQWGSFSDLQ